MSGGVDSSVAALLMKEKGYTCMGATMKLYQNEDVGLRREHTCCSLDDVEDARSVAYALDMPYYVFNFADRFKTDVIDKFVHSYETGVTPNPCIDCNRYLKFDKLFQRMVELNYDYVVTGHYAQIDFDENTGRYLLKKAVDHNKDQSYVLWSLTQEQLSRMVLPLYPYRKEQIREMARQAGLPVFAKKDSQDICFIPDGDFASFLCRYTGEEPPKGSFIDRDGKVLGTHEGIWRYTIGQRRGLGIGFGQRMFVCGIDPEQNTVTLTSGEGLFRSTLTAGEVNLIEVEALTGPVRVTAKIRYAAKPAEALLTPLADGRVQVVFDEPQRAITPGQSVVFYQGRRVFGGGKIERPL